MISALVAFCQDLVVTFGYSGVVFVAVLENFFPPLPSEAIFPFVGFVAAQGKLALLSVIVAGVGGTFIGALFWYLAGRWLGSDNLKKLIASYGRSFHIKLGDIERAERWFERYEKPAVLFARVIPLVRTFISVPAGFVEMNLVLFSLLTLVGSTVWIGLLSYAGFALGERWESVVPYVENYEVVAFILAAAAIVLVFLRGYRDRHH